MLLRLIFNSFVKKVKNFSYYNIKLVSLQKILLLAFFAAKFISHPM